MPFNLPIFLTWLRIVLIPLMVAVYYVPEPWIHATGRDLAATIIFVIAAVTDWLDGYLARKWNETSAFGAFLDPVADKLMVAAALIILVWLDRVGAILAIVIIGGLFGATLFTLFVFPLFVEKIYSHVNLKKLR